MSDATIKNTPFKKPHLVLPFKSVALSLFFCIVLGPVGLLYSSFWGGVVMMPFGIIVVCSQLTFPIILVWIMCCVIGVRSAEAYNRRIIQTAATYDVFP